MSRYFSSWARRGFLKHLTLFGGATMAGGLPSTIPEASASPYNPEAKLDFLPWYTRRQNYRSLKQSSYDTTGANSDRWSIEPGKTQEVFNQKGPGVITHIWFTVGARSQNYLKELVLRAWWDDEENPSIETPLGDFFGLNLGQNFVYQSAFLNCSSNRALNSYLPMPFLKSGRLTVTNEGSLAVGAFYSNTDFQLVPALPDDVLYLHAYYNQAVPCVASDNNWQVNSDANGLKNVDGKLNYVFAEARGSGHLMGVTMGIVQNQNDWPGEGDDMIFIDDETRPLIIGTGLEDYVCGAYSFGGFPTSNSFAHLYNGAPYITGPERVGGRYVCYRWHADNPITFTRYMKHTVEHGHANHRADNFYSCCYWYQSEPHQKFPAMAPVIKRIPAIYAVEPQGVLKP